MYKLLSHNDLDGVGCGILAKLAFGEDVKVRYNSLSSLNHEIVYFLENEGEDAFLFITDMSPDEENEKRLNDHFKEKGSVQLIDHHKTALHLNDYEWGSVVVEQEDGQLASATSLFFGHLIAGGFLEPNEAIRDFVELVRQYDTWEWEKNGNQKAHRLNSLFFLMPIEEFEGKMIERLRTAERFTFDEFETKLLNIEDEKMERYIRRKKREVVQTAIGEHLAGVVYAESYHSELGNELGKEFPHLDYIAMLNMGGKRISFRTIHETVDVSEVAGQFGGGGHQKASGCSLSTDAFKQFVEETFHVEPLKEDAKRNRYNVKHSEFGSLYKNKKKDVFLIYPLHEGEWGIEKNNNKLETTFSAFLEGERFLKREFAAWLARDEEFVDFLLELAGKQRN